MKQIFLQDGVARVQQVPPPAMGPAEVLVQTLYSCISPGTERQQAADTVRASLVGAVLRQPARLGRAWQQLQQEGWAATWGRVRGHFDLGTPCGYSLSGIVRQVGAQVRGLAVGDMVACAGAECAFHAEWVAVPAHLAVRLPEGVAPEFAATVALGAVALHGVRRAAVGLGETVAVIGLGALGLLSGLLLRKAGCRVVGLDLAPARLALAREVGFHLALDARAPDVVRQVQAFADGQGADAVLLTAAAADSAPLALAARLARRKGRVVVVGQTELHLQRRDWYGKELDLLMSTSYGPGRYDPQYERRGTEYPFAYVRWTEQRNLQAYLRCLADGLPLAPLLAAIFPLEEAPQAYAQLRTPHGLQGAPMLLLKYDGSARPAPSRVPVRPERVGRESRLNVALVGPGAFARDVHLPNLRRLDTCYRLRAVMTRQGAQAVELARRYGAQYATSDYEDLLADSQLHLLMITTRHDTHGPLVAQAIAAGKAVFVEKPLAITAPQLDQIEAAWGRNPVPVLVGFNRRFVPGLVALAERLRRRQGPLVAHYRVNTEPLPSDHWVHGAEGGGRVIGEGCHFIDLLGFLVGTPACEFSAMALSPVQPDAPAPANFQVTLKYPDGSLADLLYVSQGLADFPKEYLEVFWDGQAVTLDNFQSLRTYGATPALPEPQGGLKGHLEELRHLAAVLRGETAPLWSFEEMVATSRLTLAIHDRLLGGTPARAATEVAHEA